MLCALCFVLCAFCFPLRLCDSAAIIVENGSAAKAPAKQVGHFDEEGATVAAKARLQLSGELEPSMLNGDAHHAYGRDGELRIGRCRIFKDSAFSGVPKGSVTCSNEAPEMGAQ